MNHWKKTTFGSCAALLSGGTPSKSREDYWQGDLPWVSCKDMKVDRIYDAEDHLSIAGAENGTRVVPVNTILFVVRGMILAKEFPVAITRRSVAFNQDLKAVKPFDIVTTEYLYYWLKANTHEILGRSDEAGHGTKRLQTDRLLSLPLSLPPPDIQRKIASILSAYDDLIENNLRRIKILEEMARSLYREWFVNFRFPGHQKVRMVNSPLGKIPEGWETREMKEVADVVDCLHSKKPAEDEGGTGVLLQLFNIGENGKIDASKKFMISPADYRQWTSRIELESGDCVVTNVGRIAAVAQIPSGFRAAPGRNMTAIRPREIPPTFLIEYLLSPHMAREVDQKKDAGTIMDSLNVRAIYKLQLPFPPSQVMASFEGVARPLRRRIELLVEQNANLRQTRDLLLPKLISGELDVSDLGIKLRERSA